MMLFYCLLCSGHSLFAVIGAIRAVISVVSDGWVAGDMFS